MRALPGKVAFADAGHDLPESSPADPDIPAQHHKAALKRTLRCRSRPDQIHGDGSAYVAPPALQAELLIIVVRGEEEVGGTGQLLPRNLNLVVDLAHAGNRSHQILG